MIACMNTAAEEWDAELNKNYKLLMAELSEGEKDLLRNSQRQWIAFRDAEMKFVSTTYGGKMGTIWREMAAGEHYEIIKKRAIELRTYYQTITFDGN